MQQDKKTSSVKPRLRKNSRKRQPNPSFPDAKPEQILFRKDISEATSKQKADHTSLMKKGKLPQNDNTLMFSDGSIGKDVIVDTNLELKRQTARKFEACIIAILIIIFAAILIFTALSQFTDSTSGDKLLHNAVPTAFVTENSTYDFGEFKNFVTVGDSFEKAIDVLGLPDRYSDGTYFYGSSYITVENNIVTGYFNDPYDSLKITLGYKESDDPILRGDSARRVVKKLGSPDYCTEHEWIYFDISENFASSNSYSGNKGTLTLTFDENFLLEGYTFKKLQKGE